LASLGWGVSLTGEKGEGSPLPALVEMEVGCVGEISQHVLDLACCPDMAFSIGRKLHNALPLAPIAMGKSGRSTSEYSNWVLQRVKEIHKVLGGSYVGFEKQLWLV
jgi:hypothetical protein